MLSSREKKLLTAYVDGECRPREAKQVVDLLRRSEEARALLARLEEDSQTLRSMAALTIPIDLTAPVLRDVVTAPAAKPAPAAPARRAEAFPVWRGVAAAAAVLFLVGLGSYLLTSGDAPPPTAKRFDGPKKPWAEGDKNLVRRPDKEAPPAPDRSEKPKDQPAPEWPWVQGPDLIDPEDDDPPAKPKGTVITSGDDEPLQTLERVTLALPVVHKAHQLDRADDAKRLLDQLGTAKGFRLELLCRDGTRGLERFLATLIAKKATVAIDPVAQARRKKPLVRSDYAVYLENVTPAELHELVRDAAVADRRAAQKKPAEGRFDGALVVKPLGSLDRKELVELLGLDPVKNRPEPAKRAAKVDISKPLAEQTDKQVGDAVRGRRPGAERPVLNAIVVPLSGPRVRSAELKRYLETRTPAEEGTVQVLIVLRQV